VPVIKHLDGNCHVYVDDPCDIAMAVKVADNAKTQKYSPCNASEEPAGRARCRRRNFCRCIGACLCRQGGGNALRRRSYGHSGGSARRPAEARDRARTGPTEYLAPIISVKVVAGVDEAIAHINQYSSHHTDAILTRDHMHAHAFPA
jgi:glutamate-5-semialdehyde dehydrogenase